MRIPATSHSTTWWSENNGSWFVYLILWVLEISDHQAGQQVPSPSRAILPSCCCVFNMTLLMKIVMATAVLQCYWKNKDTVFLRRISSNSSSLGSRFKSSSSVTSDAGRLDYRVNLELVFVPLPQEDGLPGFRGVKSTGEHPKEQSLRDTQSASGWYRLYIPFQQLFSSSPS